MFISKKSISSLVEKCLYLSPFVFPLYLIRFQLLGIPFTVLEVYAYFLFFLWLVSVGLGQKIVWKKQMRGYFLGALMLFLGVTLGAIFAPDILLSPGGEVSASRTAWGIWKGWIVTSLLYFWVMLQALKTSNQVSKLLRSFVLSGVVLVLVSYGFGILADGFTYDFRLRGPFEPANYLALYILPAFLLSSYFLIDRKKSSKSLNYLNTFAWAVLAHGLFFTKSFGAFLGLFGALGLYAFFLLIRQPKWRKKILITLVSLISIFLILIVTQWNTPKFQQAMDLENRSSSSVRLELYSVASHLIGENIFLGVGPGLFQPYYQNTAPQVLGKAPLEWNMAYSHNIFLDFWLNAGLLGFLALLMIIFLVHTPFTYPLIAFWGMLIHGLFDVPFWKNDLIMVFWLLIGSILILQSIYRHSDRSGGIT